MSCSTSLAFLKIGRPTISSGTPNSLAAFLKLSGVSGTFSTSEIIYQLEDSFKSGTYARSGTTVTVTRAAHGMSNGDVVYADFISGGATDGFYQVTKVDNDNVTFTSGSGTISSTILNFLQSIEVNLRVFAAS